MYAKVLLHPERLVVTYADFVMLSISERRLGELEAELEQLREANATLARAGVHLFNKNRKLEEERDQLLEALARLPTRE
jgi:transposase-like protein